MSEYEAVFAEPVTVWEEILAPLGSDAIWRMMVADGKDGANADTGHPFRARWEAAGNLLRKRGERV